MVGRDPHLVWKTLSEEPVVRTPWFQVGLADVELPDGRRIDHCLFRLPPVVLTAMHDQQDRVLLILRYRFIPLPAMNAGGEIRAASTSAAVLMIGAADS